MALGPGDLDSTFHGGKVITDVGGALKEDVATSVAVQRDGKILLAGYSYDGAHEDFSLVRYLPDGTLDLAFGTGGRVITSMGAGSDYASKVLVQTDGKIIVAGTACADGNDLRDFALARYGTDGSLDPTFGTGGRAVTDFGSAFEGISSAALQADGKIVVGGYSQSAEGEHPVVARYDPNGVLDPAFGDNGKAELGTLSGSGAVALSGGGKIIVAAGVGKGVGVARLTADGRIDPTFGNAGMATASVGQSDFCEAVTVQSDGKILMAVSSNMGTQTFQQSDFAVVRFLTDGNLDPTFGDGGKVNTDITYRDFASDVVVQTDGSILLTGYTVGGYIYGEGSTYDIALLRYTPSGGLDPSFGNGGIVITVITPGSDLATALALQDDGKIMVAGYAPGTFGTDFVALRYHSEQIPTVAALTSPVSGTQTKNPVTVSFDFPEPAQSGSVTLSFDDGLTTRALTLAATLESAGVHRFSFDPASPTSAPQITSGPSLPDRLYSVTLSYRDSAGNSIVLGPAVNVRLDTVPPVIDGTFAPLGLSTGLSGNVILPNYGLQAVASDDIGVTTIAQSPAAGSSLRVGIVRVTLTANDAAGNATSRSFDVSVTDGTPPAISVPWGDFTAQRVMQPNGGVATLPDYRTQAVITDNVGVTLVTQDPAPGVTIAEGLTPVMLTAYDAAGNSSALTFDADVLVSGTAEVAAKGLAVPNPINDPRIPADAVWGSFGVPSLAMNGKSVGWMATVRAPLGVSFQGIFCGSQTAPNMGLRTGDSVTDSEGHPLTGVIFESLREPVFAGDDFSVIARVKGPGAGTANDTGIWFRDAIALHEVAREGGLAAGTSAKFKAFTSVAMPAPGVVCFVANLAVAAGRDTGLWVWTRASGPRLALRKGDPLLAIDPVVAVKSFKALGDVKGSSGHARYDADAMLVDVQVTLTDGRTGIVSVAADGTAHRGPIAGEGAASGGTFASIGVPASAGGGHSNSVAIATLVPDPVHSVTAANNIGICDTSLGIFCVRRGDLAPNAAATATFRSFLDPVAGTQWDGTVVEAFAGTLSGAPRAANTGIWACTDNLRLVALKGDEPPGAPGTKWHAFTSLSVLEGRGPMFVATLASGRSAVAAGNDTGLWVTDSTGALKLIVREGEAVAGKFLRSFDFLKSVGGSAGQRRAWASADRSARIIYRAFFTDGSSAIVTVAVP